jgi:hypothetical protein
VEGEGCGGKFTGKLIWEQSTPFGPWSSIALQALPDVPQGIPICIEIKLDLRSSSYLQFANESKNL